jgi:uncharacterized protein
MSNNYIAKFNLEKHIEGGYFGLIYKSEDKIIPLNDRYENLDKSSDKPQRAAGSSIYFLLTENDYSAWHRLKSDEIWHYYDGNSALLIHVIDQEGDLKMITLGNPNQDGHAVFQAVIKSGCWFSAEVKDKVKDAFGLVGCTVSPAFEYQDFELAKDTSIKQYNDLPDNLKLLFSK